MQAKRLSQRLSRHPQIWLKSTLIREHHAAFCSTTLNCQHPWLSHKTNMPQAVTSGKTRLLAFPNSSSSQTRPGCQEATIRNQHRYGEAYKLTRYQVRKSRTLSAAPPGPLIAPVQQWRQEPKSFVGWKQLSQSLAKQHGNTSYSKRAKNAF